MRKAYVIDDGVIVAVKKRVIDGIEKNDETCTMARVLRGTKEIEEAENSFTREGFSYHQVMVFVRQK